jgi:hypothetical protein
LSGGGWVAPRTECNHDESVPNVLIRDLPDDIDAGLKRRAETAGQSLQQFLSGELARVAQSPTMNEVLARIAGSPSDLADGSVSTPPSMICMTNVLAGDRRRCVGVGKRRR